MELPLPAPTRGINLLSLLPIVSHFEGRHIRAAEASGVNSVFSLLMLPNTLQTLAPSAVTMIIFRTVFSY